MPRNAAATIENNFLKGLITEATGLNYPENSCVETWDCEFDFYGRVSRRLGFDLELNASNLTVSVASKVKNKYLWKNATGDGTISFVVVQIGSTLYFYDASNVNSLSGGLSANTINLATYSASGAPAPAQYNCQFADGQGKLFVFHPYLEHIYITYNSGAGTFTATQYNLMIRDFEGVSDGLAIDNRPTASVGTLTATHKYNLFNQGWCKADLTTPELTAWDTARADMPSNCDVWWNFKNSSDAFDATTIANSGRGNTPAPKGHFVLNYYNQDRATTSGIATVTSTTSGTARATTGAFYAGRVFYAGVSATGYESKILFTQIIERPTQVGSCYQVNDPTSEDLFDLLPADGGVISLPEAGTIYKLFPVAAGLLVFAYRGVWLITGSQGIGFTATDFTVNPLSNIRTVSATSFVNVNGVPMWWNTDGIFTVQGNPLQVQSISISTIQTFFNDIPNSAKLTAKGYFNPLEQTVSWLFTTTSPGTVDEQNAYNAILNFNVLTAAFYPWTIGSGATVHDIIVVDGVGGTINETLVVDDTAVQVVDDAGNNVVAYLLTNTSITPKTKYLVSYNNGSDRVTWAEAGDLDYVDWTTVLGTGVNYTSYFITGYKLRGAALTKFQPLYTRVYHEGVGKFYMRGVWDYAESTSTGRYTVNQLCSFTDANYSNAYRRLKIRGQGVSLQYFIQSYPGAPFTVSGWAALDMGNQLP